MAIDDGIDLVGALGRLIHALGINGENLLCVGEKFKKTGNIILGQATIFGKLRHVQSGRM